METDTKMVVVDSTFLIHFLRNDTRATTKATNFSEQIFTTRINVFEILIGVYNKKSEQRERALTAFYALLDSITVLELDARSANEAARLSAELNKIGETVEKADMLIAAIALSNEEHTIITANAKDFLKIPGIKVESY